MHITILGTSIKTEDILFITSLTRGSYNYESKFTIFFRTGHSLDIVLGVGSLGLDKSNESILKMQQVLNDIRNQLDTVWQGEQQTREITMRL